jgi:hypothetical protein
LPVGSLIRWKSAVPITFNCPCGKALRVADEHAGRRVKCPACQTIGTVPEPEPQFEIVEEPEEQLAPAPAKPRPVAKPAPHDDEDDDDGRGYSVAKKNRDDEDDEKPRAKKKPDFRHGSGRTDDDDDDEDRPKKKRKKKRKPPEQQDNSGRSLEGNIINGGVGAGILAMLIAVVWFILGLMNDWIFFYPPILFIIGLVAFIKGLTGEE